MSLAYIHLSDIHFGQEKGGRAVVHDDVKERLIDDVARSVENLPGRKADGIIVTGDTAYGGKDIEYKNAGQWLDRVAGAAKCKVTPVRVVPGNHDVDRDKVSLASEWMLRQIADGGEAALDRFLENEPAYGATG
jgi:3',5'-cyclic AMP phosphodiesterase CpdA